MCCGKISRKQPLSRSEALENAPMADQQYFKVPQVVKNPDLLPGELKEFCFMTSTAIIHLDRIVKSYFMGKQAVPVLKGISLDIFKNEYVALMGPSGSGKSTLMNIIGCLDSPTEGQYILNGQDVSEMADDDLAEVRNKEIGFVFQQFNLLPRLTAAENVALPLVYAGINKRTKNEMAMAVLEKVSLTDRSHHKPNELVRGPVPACGHCPGAGKQSFPHPGR